MFIVSQVVEKDLWHRMPSLSHGRYKHTMAVVTNNLYVIGGVSKTVPVTAVEVWSAETKQFTVLPKCLPVEKWGVFSAVVHGHNILVSPASCGSFTTTEQDPKWMKPGSETDDTMVVINTCSHELTVIRLHLYRSYRGGTQAAIVPRLVTNSPNPFYIFLYLM